MLILTYQNHQHHHYLNPALHHHHHRMADYVNKELQKRNRICVFTCARDTGANHTGTKSTFIARLLYPILAPTDVSNNRQTAPETELKVPSTQPDSSQNLDVPFAIVIRIVLSSNNNDSPVVIIEKRQRTRLELTEMVSPLGDHAP